jgi:hypothetical protein
MSVEVQAADATTETTDAGIDHYVCCHDEDAGLCGVNMAGKGWLNPSDDVSCVVCADLAESRYCPLFGACWEN